MKKLLPLLITLVFLGCSEDEPSLTESFFKIYDDADFDLDYNPIDVVETSDGYIILSGTELVSSDFDGVQLIQVDQTGEFVSEIELPDYEIPVGEMYYDSLNGFAYFFAANPNSLEAVLIRVDSQLDSVVATPIGGINYPLASNVTSTGNLLLLSYDPVNLTSEISEISLTGNFLGGDNYTIGAGNDVEEIIIDHFTGANNRPLAFFCGEVTTGSYYFNGFYNFSLSMVFTNLGGSPTSVVQGQSTNAGVRAALPLGGVNFAVAGYQFTDNFQLASVALNGGNIADIYPGSDQAELKDFTPAQIISYTAGETYTVFASETEGRQIVLYFYNATTGEVAGVHYIGFINPFTFSSIKVTEDNSLIVLGSTFVAGRFERITLTKISAGEIADIIN